MPPADGHVHTEWSWDAPQGSMERTCARAVAVGLPSIAFTEHADFTPWTLLDDQAQRSGVVRPPDLDVAGYLECLQRCRERYPMLRILSGVELSEPHWHSAEVTAVLLSARFDRVLGSVHSRRTGGDRYLEITDAYKEAPPDEVVRTYLAEVERMLRGNGEFEVLAHIDYPLRTWPSTAVLRLEEFEEEFRRALQALAATSRMLEVNTKKNLYPQILRWWHEAGGDAITFGSDAHEPETLAREFSTAAAIAESCGYRPGRTPHEPWRRA